MSSSGTGGAEDRPAAAGPGAVEEGAARACERPQPLEAARRRPVRTKAKLGAKATAVATSAALEACGRVARRTRPCGGDPDQGDLPVRDGVGERPVAHPGASGVVVHQRDDHVAAAVGERADLDRQPDQGAARPWTGACGGPAEARPLKQVHGDHGVEGPGSPRPAGAPRRRSSSSRRLIDRARSPSLQPTTAPTAVPRLAPNSSRLQAGGSPPSDTAAIASTDTQAGEDEREARLRATPVRPATRIAVKIASCVLAGSRQQAAGGRRRPRNSRVSIHARRFTVRLAQQRDVGGWPAELEHADPPPPRAPPWSRDARGTPHT